MMIGITPFAMIRFIFVFVAFIIHDIINHSSHQVNQVVKVARGKRFVVTESSVSYFSTCFLLFCTTLSFVFDDFGSVSLGKQWCPSVECN